MAHKFDVKNKRKLDTAERRRMIPPHETLVNLGLVESDLIADIGCGIGYFTIPAAEIVGPGGQVFAIDTSPEMLNDVEKTAEEKGISNIKIIQTDENNLKLGDEMATFALVSNVLHEVDDTAKFLSEISRVLLNNGRIAVIEWQKAESHIGPPVNHRLDKEYVQQLLQDAGFENIGSIELGEHFYAVSGQK